MVVVIIVVSRYFVAHSVGRPLIYPGSTGLLQSGFGNLMNVFNLLIIIIINIIAVSISWGLIPQH